MIQDYPNQRSQSHKGAKKIWEKSKKNSQIIHKIWKINKIRELFANSLIKIQSKFNIPNNSTFDLLSQKKQIIHKFYDYNNRRLATSHL